MSGKIAGMSFKGGRKNTFFFCLLEYFPENDRFVVKTVERPQGASDVEIDDATNSWITSSGVDTLIVDFPLTLPICHTCEYECHGIDTCIDQNVLGVERRISELLSIDMEIKVDNPKKYEQDRNSDDLYDHNKDVLNIKTTDHILSKPFKRRLKKGFLPYWNRVIDFYIWSNYYDQLHSLFNNSFDSFGNTSFMTLSRGGFLRKILQGSVKMVEASNHITLIEFLRGNIITKRDLDGLSSLDGQRVARELVVKKIEGHFNLFIYDNDLELILKNGRAFESFLLAVSGKFLLEKKHKILPDWCGNTNFIIPKL